MNATARFLKHILPHEGFYCAAIFKGKAVSHSWCVSTDELAARLLEADRQGHTSYHACASYRGRAHRRKINVRSIRAFFLDLDAGPGKAYLNARETFEACERFRIALGLPQPLYVISGTGVHAYWVLVSDLELETWERYARGLKAACQHHGLHADASRTADAASILRPVHTHNRKADPIRVECGPLNGPYPLEQFERLLSYAPAAREPKASGTTAKLATALANTFERVPRFAGAIADQCKQLGEMRSQRGLVEEPVRYACVGVLVHCEDGLEFAGKWNQRKHHEPYTTEQLVELFSRRHAVGGATTCEHFHSINPKTCEACPHWEKINSPISLGRSTGHHSTSPSVQELGNSAGNSGGTPPNEKAETKVNELPDLPKDFYWRDDGALITKEGTRGGDTDVVVSKHSIFLSAVQRGETRGEFNLIYRQNLPHEGWRDISLPAKTVFGAASTSELADRGANIHEANLFLRYTRSAIDMLHAAKQMTTRYDQFGWKNDDRAFLYGLDLYTAFGAQRITGSDELQIRCKEEWIGPCKGGDLGVWKTTINALFASGCEPQSVALLAAFAAVLMRFQERDEGGAIIHLVTRESGTGKSTALIGAASVWGRREGLGLTNDDTRVSKALTLGALGNLPVIFDELTIRDPEAIRSFVITFTNGRDKMRATRAGEIRHSASTWQTLMISAANTSLVDTLSAQNSPEAPAWRIMEFGLDLPAELRHAQGDKLRATLRANSGHAGAVYLQWLMQPQNLAWTKRALEKAVADTWAKTNWPSSARFWVRTIAAIAVAGVIVKQLELVDFSVDRIMTWLLRTMQDQMKREVRGDWAVPALSQFINDSLLNTLTVAKQYVRGETQRIEREPKQKLFVRYEKFAKRYIVAQSALREFLISKELSYREFINMLDEKGAITRKAFQCTLGAGIPDLASGQVWCVEFNLGHESISGIVPEELQQSNVVPMTPKKKDDSGTPNALP